MADSKLGRDVADRRQITDMADSKLGRDVADSRQITDMADSKLGRDVADITLANGSLHFEFIIKQYINLYYI